MLLDFEAVRLATKVLSNAVVCCRVDAAHCIKKLLKKRLKGALS